MYTSWVQLDSVSPLSLFSIVSVKPQGLRNCFLHSTSYSKIKNNSIDQVHKEMENTKMETSNFAYKTDL